MNSQRRQPQYLDLLLLMHGDAFASGSDQSARRSWWLIVGLMLLVAFFFSLVMFVTSPQALAVDVDQLEDLTGGGVHDGSVWWIDTIYDVQDYSCVIIKPKRVRH